ncbi:MAG: aminoacetone oxidase family FAD-binding enzyme [Campylobacterales bacterium]|nr:aminoacetone oxidase family FAD-binding enzyme [Campylobacterales bacterium]
MAGALLPKHIHVAFVEANAKIGMKILVSGGGKCNLTNRHVSPQDYLANPEFITPSLEGFTPNETLAFFQEVALEERDRGKLFGKHSAKDVVKVLEKRTAHCTFYLTHRCVDVEKQAEGFVVQTDKTRLTCKRLIVASGGLSWPVIGASDVGYRVAQTFGHTLVPSFPALVGLTVQKEQFWMKSLSGISFPVRVTCKGRVCEGELLFSHKGISGPVVMDVSLFWHKGSVVMDFLPEHSVASLMARHPKKQPSSLIPLPKRFVKAFLETLGLEDKPVCTFSKEELARLETMHHYTFAPAGTVGYTKAEATKGGVCVEEVNPYTLESNLCEGLYFLGEVLDVTGKLGGYNLQWAFASAALCARGLA